MEFHFAPDFLELLVETIPRLVRAKKHVLLFFQGAGVSPAMMIDLDADLRRDKDSHSKFDLARTVIVRLNEAGDAALAARREVVRRVVEFEDFSACWDNDKLPAQGLVAKVRQLVNVKDSFSRMNIEREREQEKAREERDRDLQAKRQRQDNIEQVKGELFALFGETDPHKRGIAFEGVLNRLFAAVGILVRESFTVKLNGAGVVEQIDGAVELDGHLYLVEVKWWKDPLGVGETAPHLVRLFSRDGARGLFISATGFTEPAIIQYREALRQRVTVLATLEEIVAALNAQADLVELLRRKIKSAVLEKEPLVRFHA